MVKYCWIWTLVFFFTLTKASGQTASHSWREIQDNGSGTLVVAFSENSPFIYKNSQNELAGIEFELLQDFVRYLDVQHGVEVILEFEHLFNFESLIDTLRNSRRPVLGVASISSLEERKKQFNITKPYMPDIEIIVSSRNFNAVETLGEFAEMVKNNRAITVSNSTFERNILELKRDFFPEINLEYVRHVDFLIEEISNSRNSWGYISLPNYLTYYKSGKNISRQRFFMVENSGLSLATPLKSDWAEILDEYIISERFNPLLNTLIEKHLGEAFGEVVGSISNLNADLQPEIAANREVGVLTLEKELQDLKLRQSELDLDRKNLYITLAIIGIVLVLIGLFALYRVVQLKINTNKSLSEKNKQIKQQNMELHSLNLEKNELIGIVAHDLKNPLTSALSVAELFKEEDISDEQNEYLQLINRSLKRMNNLVTKILEIKVLESPSLGINYDNVDLKTVTNQVISALKIQSDNKGITVITNLDESKINLDKSLTIQILDNLLSNAIKFSNRNSEVVVNLKDLSDKIRFEVIDNGPGIMDEDKPQLFKKFQKLQARPTDGESSTGLGLSIVKKYVEAMNGQVWCESEFRKGATFIVEFDKN